MMRFSVCVSFLLLFFVTEYNPVNGATCTVVPTCEVTEHTLASCNQMTKICECVTGYISIRSGCGQKLVTPHISPPPGNSFQVKANSSLTLFCGPSTAERVNYEIFKNNTVTAKRATYSETVSGDHSEVGNYSCKTSIDELHSDMSPGVVIEVISSNFSNVKPRIFVPVAEVFNMSVVQLQCLDVPMGYESDVRFKVNGTIYNSPNVTVSSENKLLPVSCAIMNPEETEIAHSNIASLPNLTTTIDNVTVVVEGYDTMQIFVIKDVKATDNPRLLCVTNPPFEYLDKDTTFQWQRNGANIGPSSNIYPLTQNDNASANYTCSVTYPGPANATSGNVIKLIINDAYLKKPNISVSASKPLVGGRLKISCDVANTMSGVTYSWKRESQDITGQQDRILQFDNLTYIDNGNYSCLLTKDNFVVTSDPVKVTAVSTISKPLVTKVGTNPSNTELALGGSYTLTCTTESYTVGMNYTWLVNLTAKAVAQTFNISGVKYTDAGNYTCRVAFQGLSVDSDVFQVKIIAPGVQCKADADCSNMGTGYTGKCDTTAKRCTCASHYKMNGEKCENGAMSMISSTLMLVFAYVLSQLFSSQLLSLNV